MNSKSHSPISGFLHDEVLRFHLLGQLWMGSREMKSAFLLSCTQVTLPGIYHFLCAAIERYAIITVCNKAARSILKQSALQFVQQISSFSLNELITKRRFWAESQCPKVNKFCFLHRFRKGLVVFLFDLMQFSRRKDCILMRCIIMSAYAPFNFQHSQRWTRGVFLCDKIVSWISPCL